jgi:hypothetical protein
MASRAAILSNNGAANWPQHIDVVAYGEERWGQVLQSCNHALLLPPSLPLRTAHRPTDRAGVDAEIRRDRFQRVGTGCVRCRHRRPLVAVCAGKRLQRLGNRVSLHLRNLVEALGSPQPRLHAGHKRKRGSTSGSHWFLMASHRVAPGGSFPAVRLAPGAQVAKGRLKFLSAFRMVDY